MLVYQRVDVTNKKSSKRIFGKTNVEKHMEKPSESFPFRIPLDTPCLSGAKGPTLAIGNQVCCLCLRANCPNDSKSEVNPNHVQLL